MESYAPYPQLHRSFDRSHRRKPLRLGISRRLARAGDGHDEYVTQVRFGKARAVLIPWRDEARAEQT